MNSVLLSAVLLTVVSLVTVSQSAFTKCELAKRLKLHGAENIAEWTCLAEVYTAGTFDPKHQNPGNQGYGLWEINSREWCNGKGAAPGQNKCGFDCERFLDSFLTDDLRCLNTIYAVKGFYGFPAWFRRFKACGNTATYLKDCNL